MSGEAGANPAIAAARALISGLIAGGVRHLVICPGSRSAPLAYAAAEAEAAGVLKLTVRTDERVAGFFALGLSAAGPGVAAVATTSGTAVANLHPAVMEAAGARLGLIAVSADRPAEAHGVGANQTADQRGVFGAAPLWARTLPAGVEPAEARTAGLDAALAARGARSGISGPAHVNIQFREPLTPAAELPLGGAVRAAASTGAAWGGADKPSPPDAAVRPGAGSVRRGSVGQLPVVRLAAGPRTVVLAGFGAGPAAADLARVANWPLVVEPASGSWHGPQAVPAGRLAVELLGESVERVVVFGRPVLSRPVTRLIQNPAIQAVIVHPAGGPWFDLGPRRGTVAGAVIAPEPSNRDQEWLEMWLAAGREAWRQIASLPFPNGPAVAAATAAHTALDWSESGVGGIGHGGALVVGSSSAVRDLDLTPAPAGPGGLVAALRGVAGIDGTVSFAAGLAGGRDTETPTRVLLGDLALAHDLGGMVVPALERRPELQIVVMDDSGGGIFETLEPAGVGLEDAFERFFATPVKLDWAAAASAVGAEFAEAHTLDQLRSALATPPPGLSLVRVPLARAARRGMEARAVELSRKRLNLPRKLP